VSFVPRICTYIHTPLGSYQVESRSWLDVTCHLGKIVFSWCIFLCLRHQKQVAKLKPSNIQAAKPQGDVEPRSQRACAPSGEQGSQTGTCDYLRSLHQHEMGWHQSNWVVLFTPPTGPFIAPKTVHLIELLVRGIFSNHCGEVVGRGKVRWTKWQT
jgi:hypothetical protein